MALRCPSVIRNPTASEFREVVRKRLDAAGTTRQEAADACGVARQTVYAWLASGNLNITALAQLAKGSKEAIVLRFDPNPADIEEQAPRPEWAEGLENRIALEVVSALGSPDQVRAALVGVERLAELERRRAERRGEGIESQDQAESKP